MNKILHVNVGSYPFSIDLDAFSKLDSYLVSLETHFSKSDGSKEIMHDIEHRMAELFQEKLQGRSIVSIDVVDQCILIMGTPESFGVDWDQKEKFTDSGSQKTTHDWGIKTGKRLFRDTENAKLFGVCAGLAKYLGIQDIVWVRLAFMIGLLAFGSGVILYFALWIVMPEAKTASDRLAMAGDPINIKNIARKIEEEVDHLTDQFDDWREHRRMRRKKKWM